MLPVSGLPLAVGPIHKVLPWACPAGSVFPPFRVRHSHVTVLANECEPQGLTTHLNRGVRLTAGSRVRLTLGCSFFWGLGRERETLGAKLRLTRS